MIGFNLSNNGTSSCLIQGSASITFDIVFDTLSVGISGIKMVSNQPYAASVAQGKLDSIKLINVNKFQEAFGHFGFDCFKNTSTTHGLGLKGELEVYNDCAAAKARQKNVNQDWKEGSQAPGERVYLDISSIMVILASVS
jgi:hypothetical protein